MFDEDEDEADYCDWMRELHDRRRRHYEETKHMTPKQRADLIHRRVAPVMEEYGLKYASPETIAELRRKAGIRDRTPEPELAKV